MYQNIHDTINPRFHSGLSLKRRNVPYPYAAHFRSPHPLANALRPAPPCGSFQPTAAALFRSQFRVTRSVTAFFVCFILTQPRAKRKQSTRNILCGGAERVTAKGLLQKKRRAQSPGAGAFPSFFTVCFFPPGACSSAPQRTSNCQTSSA